MPRLASIALQVFAKYCFQNSSDISPLKYLNSNQTPTTLNLMCNSKSTHCMIFGLTRQLQEKLLWWILHSDSPGDCVKGRHAEF